MNNSIKISIIILFIWSLFTLHNLNMQKIHNQEIQSLRQELSNYKDLTMTVTAYTACIGECDSDSSRTATMEIPVVGLTAAVSVDKMYMLGKYIYIPGKGIRKVTDLLNPRFTNRIDLLVATKEEAKQWGIKKMEVHVL